MKLSTQEKAALATVLHIIQEHPAINNSSINIPLTYIPKATHSIQDIIEATKAYKNIQPSDTEWLADPIYTAIAKTHIYIEHKLSYSEGNLLALSLPGTDYFIVINLDVVGI